MIDSRHLFQSLTLFAGILLVNHFVFQQRIFSSPRILIIYAAVNTVFLLTIIFQRRSGWIAAGWHYLTPGIMDWLGSVLGFGLSAFLFYIYFFVGSARLDAEFQMRVALGLALASGAGGIVCFYFSFLTGTRWNDERIQRRSPFGVTSIWFTDIRSVLLEPWSGCLRIEAADGTRIRISVYQNGAEALGERLIRYPPAAAG